MTEFPIPNNAGRPAAVEALRERLRYAIADSLGDIYVCSRVWSAWSYGTMSEDDFAPAADDDDVLDNLVDAAIAALAQPPEAPAARLAPDGGEVSRLVLQPTDEQINELWRQANNAPWIKGEVLAVHRRFARALLAASASVRGLATEASPDVAKMVEEAKKLVRQLNSSAYSQGVADERDSWKQQEKYDKQVREQLAQLSAAIDALGAAATQARAAATEAMGEGATAGLTKQKTICKWCCGTGRFSDHDCRFCFTRPAAPAEPVAKIENGRLIWCKVPLGLDALLYDRPVSADAQKAVAPESDCVRGYCINPLKCARKQHCIEVPEGAQKAVVREPAAWISASELEKLQAGHAAFVTPGDGDGDTPLYGA